MTKKQNIQQKCIIWLMQLTYCVCDVFSLTNKT